MTTGRREVREAHRRRVRRQLVAALAAAVLLAVLVTVYVATRDPARPAPVAPTSTPGPSR